MKINKLISMCDFFVSGKKLIFCNIINEIDIVVKTKE